MKLVKYTITAAFLAAAIPALGQDKTAPSCDSANGSCSAMMDMQTEMQKQDAELDGLVAAMNSADASKKMDAIAAVVTKMVEIRKMEKAKIAEMVSQMQPGGKEPMKGCPMMGNDKKVPAPTETPRGKSQLE